MEAASENAQPRRGRPPAFSQGELAIAQYVKPDAGRRQQQNAIYQSRAIVVLTGDDPRFFWLCNRKEAEAGRQKLKTSILAELGRIEDDEALRDAAEAVCLLRPQVKAAVAMIREWRLGRTPSPSVADLARAVRICVQKYLAYHRGPRHLEDPADDFDFVRAALSEVLTGFAD